MRISSSSSLRKSMLKHRKEGVCVCVCFFMGKMYEGQWRDKKITKSDKPNYFLSLSRRRDSSDQSISRSFANLPSR